MRANLAEKMALGRMDQRGIPNNESAMMKTRLFFVVWACIVTIFWTQNASATARTCTKEQAQEAETVVAAAKSWRQFHQHFERYAHCDEGAIAKGFSTSLGYLLDEKWNDIVQLEAILKSDSAFRGFVIRHVDKTIPPERLNRIVKNVGKECPQGSEAFCKEIARAAPYEEIGEPEAKHSYVPTDGFVPDETTAIAVAEAILIPIYGKMTIVNQKPYFVFLDNEVWTISGQLKHGFVGGTFRLQLSKRDASVLSVTHGK